MLEDFLLIFYAALPCFVANMVPVIGTRWDIFSWINVPLDGGKSFRGKRIFGENKTLRGLLIGIIGATAVAEGQYFLDKKGIVEFPFELGSIEIFLLFGVLSGFGALAGDAIESFVKRQVGIKEGRPFIPFDQIDYIFGFMAATFFLVGWQWHHFFFLLLCGMVLNPITNITAYVLGIKKTFW